MKFLVSLAIAAFATTHLAPSKAPLSTDNGQRSDFAAQIAKPVRPAGLMFPPDQRRHCYYTYGTQPGFPSHGQGCSREGASPCGGPEQCSCGSNERLVTFKCGGQYFHMCWKEDVGC